MKKNELKDHLKTILLNNDVIRASFFGSYARNDYNENSDLDILIEFKDGNKSLFDLIGIKQEIEEKLKLKVDLLTYDSINPKLKNYILKDQEIIYE
jgi:uncharacterized protein